MLDARTFERLIVVSFLVVAILLPGCASTGSQIQRVPENGYEETNNYRFQAEVHMDEDSTCQQIRVRVEALNKLYLREKPPARLQLFDDDCQRPIQFDRVNYLSEETGAPVSLEGSDVERFWSENERLQHELMGWLSRAGVI